MLLRLSVWLTCSTASNRPVAVDLLCCQSFITSTPFPFRNIAWRPLDKLQYQISCMMPYLLVLTHTGWEPSGWQRCDHSKSWFILGAINHKWELIHGNSYFCYFCLLLFPTVSCEHLIYCPPLPNRDCSNKYMVKLETDRLSLAWKKHWPCDPCEQSEPYKNRVNVSTVQTCFTSFRLDMLMCLKEVFSYIDATLNGQSEETQRHGYVTGYVTTSRLDQFYGNVNNKVCTW